MIVLGERSTPHFFDSRVKRSHFILTQIKMAIGKHAELTVRGDRESISGLKAQVGSKPTGFVVGGLWRIKLGIHLNLFLLLIV